MIFDNYCGSVVVKTIDELDKLEKEFFN